MIAQHTIDETRLGNVEGKYLKIHRKTRAALMDILDDASVGVIEELPERALVPVFGRTHHQPWALSPPPTHQPWALITCPVWQASMTLKTARARGRRVRRATRAAASSLTASPPP